MKKLFLIIILIVLITIPIGLNQYFQYLTRPVSASENYQIFVITPGQPVTTIAQNLQKSGLVKNAFAFRLLVAQMGIGKNIQAGDFRISGHMSSREIAEELTHGAIDVWVTIPEGFRVEEIGESLEAKLKTPQNDKYQFDKKEFIALAKEGYMFPDTYLIPKDITASDLDTRLQTTFNEKVNHELLAQGSKNDLSPEEVITLASLIEREAKSGEERPIIAGVLINRIRAGIALQVDATVQYAKGYDSAKNSWWPPVTQEDYQAVKSRYNTYLYAGLPPTPIANPGLEAIRAAAGPADTDYFYYLHDQKGQVHFAKTIDEHAQNIQKYLQ